MPGIGEEIDGAMQQAPQPARHCITVETRNDKTLEATRDFGRARENSRRFVRRQAQPIVTLGAGAARYPPSLSNLFMTFARHDHLKALQGTPGILPPAAASLCSRTC